MQDLYITQIELKSPYRHIQYHKFSFPEFNDKGFYRTMISYDAFFEGVKVRNYSKNYLYYLRRDKDWEDRNHNLPVIEHENLLDFFKNIGYSRETKEFVGKEKRTKNHESAD